MKYPDPKKHQAVSFFKSALRLIGYAALLVNLPTAVVILIASEALGIYEETV